MLFNLLQAEQNSQQLIYGFLGLLIAFAVTFLLIGGIWLIGRLIDKARGEDDNFNVVSNPVASNKQDEQQKDEQISDEVKVAIIAAIMAYYQEERPKCDFVVKRIKRL